MYKEDQKLGVGDITEIHKNGTASVNFYEALKGSTLPPYPQLTMKLPLDKLAKIIATEDSYQWVDESKSVEQSAGFAIVYNGNYFFQQMKS